MLTVNLASEPVALLKRVRLGLIGAAIALLISLTAMVVEGLSLRQSLEMETVRTARLSAERLDVEKRLGQEGLVLTEANRAAIDVQVKVANQMIDQRLFSWSSLFLKLERATPAGVSLASVQPQPANASLTLKGEALTLERLTSYVGKLQEAAPFHDVFLADQTGRQDGTVSFTLHVGY
jgi:hypothetical protein